MAGSTHTVLAASGGSSGTRGSAHPPAPLLCQSAARLPHPRQLWHGSLQHVQQRQRQQGQLRGGAQARGSARMAFGQPTEEGLQATVITWDVLSELHCLLACGASLSRPHCARGLESILQLACSKVVGAQRSKCQAGTLLAPLLMQSHEACMQGRSPRKASWQAWLTAGVHCLDNVGATHKLAAHIHLHCPRGTRQHGDGG